MTFGSREVEEQLRKFKEGLEHENKEDRPEASLKDVLGVEDKEHHVDNESVAWSSQWPAIEVK